MLSTTKIFKMPTQTLAKLKDALAAATAGLTATAAAFQVLNAHALKVKDVLADATAAPIATVDVSRKSM